MRIHTFKHKFSFTILLLVIFNSASAYDFKIKGVAYNINSDNLSVTVVDGTTGVNGVVDIPEDVTYNGKEYNVTEIAGSVFRENRDISQVYVPQTVTSIGSYAFYNAVNMNQINLSDNITIFKTYTFRGCQNVKTLKLPSCLERIEWAACEDMRVSEIEIPNTVEYIGRWAFTYNENLQTIKFSSNSNLEIEGDAFNRCPNIKEIYIDAIMPPKFKGDNFDNHNAILHVPLNSIDAYKNAEVWNKFIIMEYPITAISLNNDNVNMYKGSTQQLTASIEPNNATIKTIKWESSNPNVATVDQDGLVTAINLGIATITATTTDGTDLSATCDVTVTGISQIALNKSSTNINIGGSEKLLATIFPSDVIIKTLAWESSNPNVATVDQDGLVTAINLGMATITATTTDGTDLSATCDVTVTGISQIALNKSSTNIYIGGSEKLLATIFPSDVIIKTLAWESSNPNIATVDQDGLVTAINLGMATITATTTDGTNLSATCDVAVTGISRISLNKTSTNIYVGDSEKLLATIFPSDVINKTLAWESSNPTVAIVDQEGLVTSIRKGTTTITALATDGTGVSASCVVTVLPNYELSGVNLYHLRGVDAVYDFPISLTNKKPISAIQFVVTLPEAVTLERDSYGDYNVWLDSGRKARNHSVSIEPWYYDNSYLIVVSSPTNRTFNGSNGPILHLNVRAKYHDEVGKKFINYSEIVASEADETQHSGTSEPSEVRLSYLVGDANADVVVDVADYVITANYILGRNTGPYFYTDAANAAYGDNKINVTDLVAITNIALDIRDMEISPSGAPQQALTQKQRNHVARTRLNLHDGLYINDFSINAGEKKTVEMILDNDTSYCALQTDIVLPEGITIDLDGDEYIVDPTSRSNKHVISSNLLENGAVRVFVTSQNSRAFTGSSGAILTIDITASDTFDKGVLTLTNTVLVEENGIRHLFDDATASVNGGGTKGDVNGDGVVSGADVTALYNVLLDNAEAGGNPDVNEDGVVSGADVTALYNLLLN